jgi:hypothetical protein
MAKITISEKDISKIPSNEVGNDVVYVPGYAVTGPANTPTLCRTLSEFQKIFGINPYLFEKTETYNDVFAPYTGNSGANNVSNNYLTRLSTGDYNFCLKNSVETSYVYAVELLSKGMPIIFERVVDDSLLKAHADLVDSTGNKILRVVAKYPGRYGQSISYILEKDSANYKLTITQDSSFKNSNENDVIYLSKPSTEPYTISLDPYSSNYFENVNYGMVDIIKGENFNQNSTLVESSKTEDGLIVETYLTNTFSDTVDFSLNTFYGKLESSVYSKLEDKNEYAIKYLTSGGYPNYFESSKLNTGKESISKTMAQVATKRSDCIAILDYIKNDNDVNLTNLKTSIQLDIDNSNVQTKDFNFEQIYKYAVMFAPYGKYKSNVLGGTYILPASFAYLNTLAESLKTNPSWYAVAGITRGIVSNLEELVPNMTGAMADDLQPSTGVCINPILNIKPYGYTI